MGAWVVEFTDVQNDAIRHCESLCTLCNGYFAIRGAAEESSADGYHYPATYLAGVYNSLDSVVEGRHIINEDLVNCPNALLIDSYPVGLKDSWEKAAKFVSLKLNLADGCLERVLEVCDSEGRKTRIETKRLVSIKNAHIAVLQYTITPLNWSSEFIVTSGIDGKVTNQGVQRYQELNNMHLRYIEHEFISNDLILLSTETTCSKIQIALAIRNHIYIGDAPVKFFPGRNCSNETPSHSYQHLIKQGESLRLEKIISIFNSKDNFLNSPKYEAIEIARTAENFTAIYHDHRIYWNSLWKQCDINLGKSDLEQKTVRLHIFHLLQTLTAHSIGLDCGAPARGWHGEAYRGHIFWDELFIFPFLNLHYPQITRALLMYRYRRLGMASQLAKNAGFQGAMFPWQSAGDGSEASQFWHLNPNSGRWARDHSSYQRHVNCAIAYNVWSYYQITADQEFLFSYGAPILIEITRFLVSLTSFNKNRGLYEIKGVVGPDEYHEQCPKAEGVGVDNNAYTNVMTVWVIGKALELVGLLSHDLLANMNITDLELDTWEAITRKMFIPFHEGVISQFERYELLEEFKWGEYGEKYGNIERLDRILESENDSTNNYKVSKQADVVMLFYLLSKNELKSLFDNLGFKLTDKIISDTIEYYYSRCSHGSSLSKMVYSSVLNDIKPELSRDLYLEALMSDFLYSGNGTTGEGIHLGLMAGTAYHIVKHALGITVLDNQINMIPKLPVGSKKLKLKLKLRGHNYEADIQKDCAKLTLISKTEKHYIYFSGQKVLMEYDQAVYVP